MAFNVNGRDLQTEVCSQKLEVDLEGVGGGKRTKTQNIQISFSPSGKCKNFIGNVSWGYTPPYKPNDNSFIQG